jgi:hypothetical protein
LTVRIDVDNAANASGEATESDAPEI